MKAETPLIIVAMVDPNTAPTSFNRTRLDWPLHVTIVPWFEISDEGEFLRFLIKHIASEQAFRAEVGPGTAFGVNSEIPVNLILNRTPFGILHNYILELIEGKGGLVVSNSGWLRGAYKPHVTHHGADRLHEGDTFDVNSLTALRLLPGEICEVTTTIPLKGSES